MSKFLKKLVDLLTVLQGNTVEASAPNTVRLYSNLLPPFNRRPCFALIWNYMNKLIEFLRSLTNRTTFANVLMSSFILFTAIGGFLIAPPIGFIVAGVACGVFGYLLGAE